MSEAPSTTPTAWRRTLRSRAAGRGLTLVELLVSLAILSVIASIAIPAYEDGLEDSQVAEARVEVRGLEMEIERYFQVNGLFPETLAEVGMEDTLDPWGNPYQYLRLQAPPPASMERAAAKPAAAAERTAGERAPDAAAGDGDAVAAAAAEGSGGAGRDAAASGSSGRGSGGSGGSGARAASGGSGTAATGGGTTAGSASGGAEAAGDGAAAAGGGAAAAGGSAGAAGGAGGAQGQARKDHNLVPINTDFDLYSMGPDGRSAPPLTAAMSRDDIVRGNNGRYIGEASGY